MAAKWVDFKDIKQQVSMADILAYYGMRDGLQEKGQSLVGPCPLHGGTNPTQFHVSLAKNNFHCFGDCKADPKLNDGGGNVLDFVAKKEEVEIRQAALMIQDWFSLGSRPKGAEPRQATSPEPVPPEPEEELPKEETEAPEEDTGVKENKPLTFTLQVNPEHTYLQTKRGFRKETADAFGMGIASRGMMKGRIAIPIHDAMGALVAYVGRFPGDKGFPEGEGKYKLPPKFHKSLVVYNLHRAREYAHDQGLIVVEGYFDVMRLWQEAHLNNVVALMGSSLSPEQEALIVEAVGPQGRATLLFDEDAAGWAVRENALTRLSSQIFVKVVGLGAEGKQPDGLTKEEIRSLGLL